MQNKLQKIVPALLVAGICIFTSCIDSSLDPNI